MQFANLKVAGWRQFADVNLDFHPRLTVLAGANGAGKSTLLRVLSQHFGYAYNLVATPTISKAGVMSYLAGIFRRNDSPNTTPQAHVGSLTYTNGHTSPLVVPIYAGVTYSVQIPQPLPVEGLFINSHRPTSGYQAISSIPTNAITVEQAYQAYNQEVMNKYNNAFSQFSPIYRIKEAIVSMATFGPGNRNVQRNASLEQIYEQFKDMLSKVLPDSIGFETISIRIPDVVIVTKTGEFTLDAASGGLMALVDLAWQMFLYSQGKEEFVAIIDEPENHLHPSMQRIIISKLLEAFPSAQLIVATHSPFIVSSVRDSAVYVLRHRENTHTEGARRTVHSERLDQFNKAATAGEILKSVLGVPVTLPLWAEGELEHIIADFELDALDSAKIDALRGRLDQAGLSEFYPDALTRMAQRR